MPRKGRKKKQPTIDCFENPSGLQVYIDAQAELERSGLDSGKRWVYDKELRCARFVTVKTE